MPIRVDPHDLGRFGPAARARIAAALEPEGTAPVQEAVPLALAPTPAELIPVGPAATPNEPVPPPPPRRQRRAIAQSPRRLLRWWAGLGAALVVLLAGMIVGGLFRPVGAVPASLGPAAPAGLAVATPGSTPAVDARALAAQAGADAVAATLALSQVRSAAAQVDTLVASAQGEAAQVATLAAPKLARDPAATSPVPTQSTLRQDQSQLAAALSGARQAEAAGEQAAANAAALPQALPTVAMHSTAAATSAAQAQAALGQAAEGATTLQGLLFAAQTEVGSWQAIHAAPAGTLGAVVTDPPADWTVQGCEVVTASPGGAVATAGLIGRTQRTDPVGDVITAITDATDAQTTWPIPDCTALQAAMAKTRVGDGLTIAFAHRQVTWYLLGGSWRPRAGGATLAAAPSATCPAPLTGSITPGLAGNRIALQVNLSGPTGTRSGMGVILDTGGVQTTFPDAVLRSLGFTPFPLAAGIRGVVPGAAGSAYLYHMPGSALTVDDGGRAVPVATGTLSVWGIVGGADSALGPDILKHGAQFSSANGRWTLTPPCA